MLSVQPPLFGLQQQRFQYASTPEGAAQRLMDVLRKPEWKSIVAKVTPTKVQMYKRLSPLFYNSFNPIFVGRFEPNGNGTVLVGRFRMSWFGICFLVVFFGMIVYNLIDTYLQPEQRPGYVAGWRAAELKWHLEFLGFALLVAIVGWLIGIPNKNAIVRAIKESI
jgi:hypothetical protein